MTIVEELASMIFEVAQRAVEVKADSRLKEDLNLDSANLIELTILLHTKYGVDIGRKSAESGEVPETVGDLARLLTE